jgi:hypothetical protein
MADQQPYYLKGHLLGACSCDWGCPCSFEARPTQGFCEGNYVWHIEEGHYQGTPMAGSTFGLFIRFPAAPHEGNGTGVVLVDETVPEPRRPVLESMLQSMPPFSIFWGLLSTFLGFRYVPLALHLDGIHSRLTIPTMVDLQLTPMTNPVTGADELATLYKPTGFTSKTHELCATRTYRVTLDGLAYDHSGKYGEFSPFEYAPA